MSRFYFHIRQDDFLTLDDEGLELSSIDAARDEAASSTQDLVRSGLLEATIQIMDDAGNFLDAASLRRTLH
jgi:hypothetical protein